MSQELALDKKAMTQLSKIAALEVKYQKLFEKRKLMTEQIKTTMEKYDIKKWSNEEISITYVPATTSTTFDGAQFKKDQPVIYQEYLKQSPRAASVRLKLKGDNEDVSEN